MDNQQNSNVFGKILGFVKSILSRIASLFNRHGSNEDQMDEYMPMNEQNYSAYNGYQQNPYQQPMMEMQEPLTMASAREMSRHAGRRRQSSSMETPQQAHNGFQPEENIDAMQANYQQMGMKNSYQPYSQMNYPNMQPQFDNNQGMQNGYPTMQPMQQSQYPTMQPMQQTQYPTMQNSAGQSFTVERNPLLDTNIAVFVLLKPEDCHEMLKGIVNPSLYIINMENMVDESTVTYCKHVLMGAKLVLNYAIHRISSKNIYMLCPKQINIKMDDVARNLIARYDREPRGYAPDNREIYGKQEFGF